MSRRQCRPLKVFQSTLPARGATAPAGCSGGSGWYFNPRSPHGERPTSSWAMAAHKRFQSTLPARGATGQAAAYFRDDRISIHAPRTGSDRNMAVRAYPEKIFQSTLPARGATRSATRSSSSLTFQSTLPARGATVCRAPNRAGTADFNPRSLHGERHIYLPLSIVQPISIHAPCTGSDATLPHAYRQPRFQSTLPARGATGTNVQMQSVKAISIHAPCTGSDYVEPSGLAVHTNFNPRSPHGERHSSAPANTSPPGISIHAPRTGSDYTALLPPSSQWISIHAPRTGSDVCDSVLNSVDSLFQSTLPARGATFGILRCVADLKSFQSTLPARGATRQRRRNDGGKQGFQSTLPARGATQMLCGLKITGIFQSTLPARGATPAMLSARPRAAFQSTLPARGATLFALSSTLRCDNFNPRSPHGERPSSSSQSFRIPSNFNPRSPHGERRIAWNSKTARSYFNPRSPHGERLDPTKLERTSEKFQSTLPARGATAASTVSTSVTRTFQPTLPARGATSTCFSLTP